VEPEAEKLDADDYDEATFHGLTSPEVVLPKGDYQYIAKVIGRKRDSDGNPVGRYHPNPILDTSIHEVEFPDGTISNYAANVLTEALYSQIDAEGNRWLLLKDITDHKKDNSALSEDELRQQQRTHTTKGWRFNCLWADGSSSWKEMRNLKHSNPVELAEYAQSRNLLSEAAFNWWSPYVLHKKNRIIKKVKSRYWQRTHKYGVRLPKSATEALDLDKENGNTLWYDAIQKEMRNVKSAFQFLPVGSTTPIGSKKIPCHIIFDVRMDFSRKARFVAGEHKTDPPSSLTYSSVMSGESVRIAFLLAVLNGLDILSADIGNACKDIHTSRYCMPTCTRQHAQCRDSTMTPTRYLAEILAYLSLQYQPSGGGSLCIFFATAGFHM
jgi:hypothetical protein